MVRFGESTLRDGAIPADAFARGLATLKAFKNKAEQMQPEVILAVATSSLREAANGPDFVRAVAAETGLELRVIDSIEEARLIYIGARQSLDLKDRRVLLLDVGGGSTEVLVADRSDCFFATSLRLGALRLRDQWKCSDPPTSFEISIAHVRARALAQPTTELLGRIGFDFVALTSGTALSVARLLESDPLLRQAAAEPGLATLRADELAALEKKLASLTMAERALLPGLEPRRVDTILPGTIIIRTLLELVGVEQAIVCDSALKHGVVVDYLTRRTGTGAQRVEQMAEVFGAGPIGAPPR
jgi:exopolyphosphatase/guanosine-5'-triphosphate,3'-diphosphate pyrophosphatase